MREKIMGLKNRLASVSLKHKLGFIFLGSALVIAGMTSHHSRKEKSVVEHDIKTIETPIIEQKEDTALKRKLTEIEEKLARIQSKVSKPSEPTINLAPISSEINALGNKVSMASKESTDELKASFEDKNKVLQAQLKGLQDDIKALKKAQNTIKQLPVSALPFKVLSVDSIQQENVVSLYYHYKTIPIESGDELAGWKLVSASYGSQQAEFVNSDDEHVFIALKATA